MRASIRVANVKSVILNETRKEIVIVKDGKTFIGALFFKKDEDDRVNKVHEKVEFEGSATEMMLTAYKLMKKHGLILKDTLKTMVHWQYMNGLTDEMITDGYKVSSDSELFEKLEQEAR